MIERDKQRRDQEDKHAAAKRRQEQKKQPRNAHPHEQAGSDTKRKTMQDKDYIEHIEEKTEKH